MARCIVTGATGFVGSHLVEALLEGGHDVVCIARPTSDRRWLAGRPVTWVEADLGDPEALAPLVASADYVYHVAGATRAVRPDDFERANAGATAAIARACAQHGQRLRRLLVVSSQAAAGPGTRERPRREDDPPAPVSPYGRSKLAAERAALESGAPVTVVRPAAVYGPRDRDGLAVYRLVRLGLRARIGASEAVSLIHVRDLARGLVLAAEAERSCGRVYFLAHPEPLAQEDLARRIAGALGTRGIALPLPSALVRLAGVGAEGVARLTGRPSIFNRSKVAELLAPGWVCDASRARVELGFEASVEHSAGIADTVAWYRSVGWL